MVTPNHTNPQETSANIFQFFMTFVFWFLPSLLWKKTTVFGLPIPGAQTEGEEERLDVLSERVTGVLHSLADSGPADIYNRVLCPTCILQIVLCNTLVVSQGHNWTKISFYSGYFQYLAQMIFWSTASLLPPSLPFG